MVVPIEATAAYEAIIAIAQRLIRTAEERIGAPGTQVVSVEPIRIGALKDGALVIYDFDTDSLECQAIA